MPHRTRSNRPAFSRRLLALLATLAPLAPLVAQQDGAGRRARLQRELDPATFAAVTLVADSAARRGVPADLVLNKALEGTTMRRPAATIRRAVETYAARLEVARRALTPASPAELEAGAEALARGIGEGTLRELRAARPGATLRVELGVLVELIVTGRVPVARASAQVLDLVRRGAHPAQIFALGGDVARDVAERGYDPAQALEVRARGVLAGSGTAASATTLAPAELANDGSGGRSSTGAPKAPRPRRP